MLKETLRYSEEKLLQTKNSIPSQRTFEWGDDGMKMFVDRQGLRKAATL